MKLASLLLLFGASLAQSAIVITGNPRTGSPAAGMQITAPIVLTSTSNTEFYALALDNWVTSDATANNLTFVAGTTLSYQINGGSVQTIPLGFLRDNLASNAGNLTVGDGLLVWGTNSLITVPIGQTLTLLPGTFAFSNSIAAFNPGVPVSYNGPVFAYAAGGIRTTDITNAPEPSTAILGALGALVFLRRRR